MSTKILVFTADRHEAARWAEVTDTPNDQYIYVESVRDIRGRLTTHMPRVISPSFQDKPGAENILAALEAADCAMRF